MESYDRMLTAPPSCSYIQLAGASTHQPEQYETDITLSHLSSILNEQGLHCCAVSSIIVNQDKYIENSTSIALLQNQDRHSIITPKHISRTWKIGFKTAQETLQCTTQRGICTTLHPI